MSVPCVVHTTSAATATAVVVVVAVVMERRRRPEVKRVKKYIEADHGPTTMTTRTMT